MKHERNKFSVFVFIKELAEIYLGNKVSRSAAELSYYITLSIFPTLICVYAAFQNLIPDIEGFIMGLGGLMPAETLDTIAEYLAYVARHNNSTMLTAGIIGTATTSAAAFRSLHHIMGQIQGESRFRGAVSVLFSFLFSLILLTTIYFAMIVLMTGHQLFRLPVFRSIALWNYVKYPILFLLFIFIIYGVYRITAPRDLKDTFFPGAFFGAAVLALSSALFSWFIGISTRYPIIYGSLASMIIFMVWIYVCGTVLIMGNAFNVVLRRYVQRG